MERQIIDKIKKAVIRGINEGFDIDDMSNPITDMPVRKSSVGKHSKIHDQLYRIMSNIDVTRIMATRFSMDNDYIRDYVYNASRDDLGFLDYIYRNQEELPDDTIEYIREGGLWKVIERLALFKPMVRFVSVAVAPDTKFTDDEYEFLLDAIQGIESKDHPLYAFFRPKTKHVLHKIIVKLDKYRNDWMLVKQGMAINLNWIDVSRIQSMDSMFESTHSNFEIYLWDVSKVTNMHAMFKSSYMSADLTGWNVGKVEDMSEMFYGTQGQFDISNWDVSHVVDMKEMFSLSSFDGDISGWDVSQVTNMNGMFHCSFFNGDISQWDVSSVGDMGSMFSFSQFRGDISQWNVSRVYSMAMMFHNSLFKGDISGWDVSHVSIMNGIFMGAQFNGDISGWDVSHVIFLGSAFAGSAFTSDISRWKVSPKCEIRKIFYHSDIPDEHKPLSIKNRQYEQ